MGFLREYMWRCHKTANFLKKSFGFAKIKILLVHEFRVWVWNSQPCAHFEESVEEDDECWEMTGNSLATFQTFSTVCWTAFPTDLRVDQHSF
jgi:hypothetical protein